MYQVDTDSRSNFPTERSFHIFKKQRFINSLISDVKFVFFFKFKLCKIQILFKLYLGI